MKPLKEYKDYKEIPAIYYMPKKGGVIGGTFMRNYDGLDHKLNHEQFMNVLERNKRFFGSNVKPTPKL